MSCSSGGSCESASGLRTAKVGAKGVTFGPFGIVDGVWFGNGGFDGVEGAVYVALATGFANSTAFAARSGQSGDLGLVVGPFEEEVGGRDTCCSRELVIMTEDWG